MRICIIANDAGHSKLRNNDVTQKGKYYGRETVNPNSTLAKSKIKLHQTAFLSLKRSKLSTYHSRVTMFKWHMSRLRLAFSHWLEYRDTCPKTGWRKHHTLLCLRLLRETLSYIRQMVNIRLFMLLIRLAFSRSNNLTFLLVLI